MPDSLALVGNEHHIHHIALQLAGSHLVEFSSALLQDEILSLTDEVYEAYEEPVQKEIAKLAGKLLEEAFNLQKSCVCQEITGVFDLEENSHD